MTRLWFADMPNEVLVQVLDHLDNADINNLLAVPQISARIANLFCLVSDSSPSIHFSNIPAVLSAHSIAHGPTCQHTDFLFALVEVNDLQHSHQLITQLSNHIHNRVSVFDEHVNVTDSQWMALLGPHTQSIRFETIERLSLSNLVLDPHLFNFPRLKCLTLVRCDSSNTNAKFDFPQLRQLTVKEHLNTVNESIDFENHTNLDSIVLTEIEDIHYWKHVSSSSVKEITINECDSLVKLSNLELTSLTKLTIKDTDIVELCHLHCPNLKSLHVEQFMQSTVSIHDLNLPSLESILLWVFKIDNMYNVSFPKVQRASIMLSNEPVELLPHQNIDLSCFKSVSSIQLCLAVEVLKFIDNLEELEVRGPFNNPILFDLKFTSLSKLHINNNNSLLAVPLIKAPGLSSLKLSRCISIREIKSTNFGYTNLEKLLIEYSGLSLMSNLTLPKLKLLKYISSTSQPLFFRNCHFSKLKVFEATNLDIMSTSRSSFNFSAPLLLSLKITNFNIDAITISGSDYPVLSQLSLIGGIDTLKLVDCQHLKDLDISRNEFKQLTCSGELSNLTALECEGTNILQFELNTPLLKRIVYDEIIAYVRKDQ